MTSKFNKLAFVGQMGAGKDTVAALFKDSHISFAFGTGIRETIKILRAEGVGKAFLFIRSILLVRQPCYALIGILEYALNFPKTFKDRDILQYLGSSARVHVDSIWIDYCFTQIKKSGAEKVVITDCRRVPELNALKAEGFTLIYVDAPMEVRFKRLEGRDGIDREEFFKTSGHLAESEIAGLKKLCDYVIDNSNEDVYFAEYQLNKIIKGNGEELCY